MITALIVGAGPAGLTMAIELTRFNVPVRIIDKATVRTEKSKAFVLWSRSLELLERSVVSGALVAYGYKIQNITIASGEKSIGYAEATGRLASLATVKNRLAHNLRSHVASLMFGLASVRELASSLASELSVHYCDSPLNAAEKRLAPYTGQRAATLAEQSPVGIGDSPRFAVFGEGGEFPAALMKWFLSILEPTIRKAFHPGGLWLVRPDGYVAVSIKAGNWESVSAYLSHFQQKGRAS